MFGLSYLKLAGIALMLGSLLFVGWVVLGWKADSENLKVVESELTTANQNVEEVVNEYGILVEKNEKQAKERHKLRLKSAKLERKVANLISTSIGTGDVDALNEQLRMVLRRIEGSPTAVENELPETRSASNRPDANPRTQYAAFLDAMFKNLNRCADFVEEVYK